MHRPDLGVQTETAPQVAPDVEAVEEVRREERRRRGTHGGGNHVEVHPAHRPEDRERKKNDPEVADDVEDGEDVDRPSKQAMKRDDGEMGEVLVIEELREALVHLGDPELENILPARERIA